MKINAYAVMKAKEELQKFNYNSQPLGPNDVEVKITHCGICHTDIHLIDNDFQMSSFPFVPGHEIVGTISAKGDAVKHLELGQRAGVGWQSGSCHTCEWCISGQENLCNVANQPTCVGKNGGFSEKIMTDGRFAFPIPDKLESENAAPLLCGGITVYSPLKIYNVKPHHKVGVIGIGGLGHLAIQFAAAMGCEVTAFSTSPDKEAEARELGASKFVFSKDKKQMESITGSLDFIISAVTAPLTWKEYTDILRPNGRLNFVGASPGNVDIPIFDLLLNQKSVSGSVIGGRAMIQEMLEFASRHNIKAKTETVPMEKVNSALKKVRDNKARYRMVLTN
jgi:uncharacterized zinc-type alcohol dehydrogenase-like protein